MHLPEKPVGYQLPTLISKVVFRPTPNSLTYARDTGVHGCKAAGLISIHSAP